LTDRPDHSEITDRPRLGNLVALDPNHPLATFDGTPNVGYPEDPSPHNSNHFTHLQLTPASRPKKQYTQKCIESSLLFQVEQALSISSWPQQDSRLSNSKLGSRLTNPSLTPGRKTLA
jgi:hypothetical protein